MTVLTYLMGGGSSFSSGGPGKGMHSRLYTRVLNNYHWCHSCAAFSNTQNNTGLVGIQAAAEPAYAKKMLDVICGELEVLTSPPPADQLERAKAMSISLIHNALESKAASTEDLGRQYLTYGHRVSGADYVQMIQAVSPKAIAEFAQRLLASPPSLVLYGDGTEEVADYEALTRRFEPRRQALAGGGRGQRAAPGFLERLRQQVGRG
jgi:processing peptidase subunit alpha